MYVFFFNDSATTEIYTLSLHDALPISFLTAAVSGALMAGRQQSKLARDTLNASFLAQSLMDEVMRLPFTDPLGYTSMGPDANETTRSSYDNVDDYSGYTDGVGTDMISIAD